MGKKKVLKYAIEILQANKKGLTGGTMSDHDALVRLNDSLLSILLDED